MKKCPKCSRPGKSVYHTGKCPKDKKEVHGISMGTYKPGAKSRYE